MILLQLVVVVCFRILFFSSTSGILVTDLSLSIAAAAIAHITQPTQNILSRGNKVFKTKMFINSIEYNIYIYTDWYKLSCSAN